MTARPEPLGSPVTRLWDALENPVLGREFRSRMRGARSYVITGCYTLVVMVFVLAAYWMLASQAGTGLSPLGGGSQLNRQAAGVGRGIWTWGCLAQAALLPLMVPAFTCGAITLERERELLDLLLLTRQSAFQICLGKLASGIGLGLMLVLASVPVLSLSVLLGGVSPGEIGASLCVLVTAVVAAGTLGLTASTLAPRTTAATAAVYLIVGGGQIGVPLLLAFLGAAQHLSQAGSELGILAMLGACMLVAFPPAVGLAVLLATLHRRRTGRPFQRTAWMLSTGLCWSGLLLFLYLPGMFNLLLGGQAMLLLHPMAAIQGVMSPASVTAGIWSSLWWVCAFAYVGASVWLFYISVLRVQRLRC